MKKLRFGLIGAGAYVAPRHIVAIADTGNDLVCAFDPYDSVGILDRHFLGCEFFTEFARFDRFVDKSRRHREPLDWLVIVCPNYLHDAYIRYGLRNGINVICEKPLVTSPWNLDGLTEHETESRHRVFGIMQMRIHPETRRIQTHVRETLGRKRVSLRYVTARGPWFEQSWKGNEEKSGGIATNIGIHFLDLLISTFGNEIDTTLSHAETSRIVGHSAFERADVDWFLSYNPDDLDADKRGSLADGLAASRSLVVDGESFDFSTGFERLHTDSYLDILAGRGFGINDARPSIELAYKIRQLAHDVPRVCPHLR